MGVLKYAPYIRLFMVYFFYSDILVLIFKSLIRSTKSKNKVVSHLNISFEALRLNNICRYK